MYDGLEIIEAELKYKETLLEELECARNFCNYVGLKYALNSIDLNCYKATFEIMELCSRIDNYKNEKIGKKFKRDYPILCKRMKTLI